LKQAQYELQVQTRSRGLLDITEQVVEWTGGQQISTGLLTLFIRHTSASLTIQENADPDVVFDLDRFFSRLVEEDPHLYRHRAEGPDDMPAHIRSALTDVSLSIPVSGGQPVLGTWQAIYLFEHRMLPHRRRISLHLLGL